MQRITPAELFHPSTGPGDRGSPNRRRPAEIAQPVLTPAHLLLPRLRYFGDLVVTGYQSAVRHDLFPRSLRVERIALGIDLPELDAVPLWSTRRADGDISVPCLEHLLSRIGAGLARLESYDVATPHGWPVQPQVQRTRLSGLLTAAGLQELRAVTPPPRLEDLFLPEPFFTGLCGRDGLLTSIIEMCDSALNARSH